MRENLSHIADYNAVMCLYKSDDVLKIGWLTKEHGERQAGCFRWVGNLYNKGMEDVCIGIANKIGKRKTSSDHSQF